MSFQYPINIKSICQSLGINNAPQIEHTSGYPHFNVMGSSSDQIKSNSLKFIYILLIFLAVIPCIVLTACSIPVEVHTREELHVSIDLDQIVERIISDPNSLPNDRIPQDFYKCEPIELSWDYDLRENEDIKPYISTLRNIRIQDIYYRVEKNSINIPLPGSGNNKKSKDQDDEALKNRIKVLIGKHGEKNLDTFYPIGYFLYIPAGKNHINDSLQLTDGGKNVAQMYIKELLFRLAIKSVFCIDGEQYSELPSGSIDLKIIMDVSFNIDIAL